MDDIVEGAKWVMQNVPQAVGEEGWGSLPNTSLRHGLRKFALWYKLFYGV